MLYLQKGQLTLARLLLLYGLFSPTGLTGPVRSHWVIFIFFCLQELKEWLDYVNKPLHEQPIIGTKSKNWHQFGNISGFWLRVDGFQLLRISCHFLRGYDRLQPLFVKMFHFSLVIVRFQEYTRRVLSGHLGTTPQSGSCIPLSTVPLSELKKPKHSS